MKVREFLTESEEKQIIEAIKTAEKATSGEIKVHIESKCPKEVIKRATVVFNKLNMHKTELRNGVLFYVAVHDKKFAILGDHGINNKVPTHFWEDIKTNMQHRFKHGEFALGLSEGILKAGEQLKVHFPYQKGYDVNELSDDISIGE